MPDKKKKSALHVQPGVGDAQPLNPHLREQMRKQTLPTAHALIEGIQMGNVSTLSRAITLIESTNPQHFKLAEEVINACSARAGKSLRLGITGIPGVGKSTFIEAFGLHLIKQCNKKVAVLAVDPSSEKNKGSILGDKTRMEELSQNKDAFIRPSPSAGSLGGVARKTRETIMLCEAAGFDVIIIETVGVGQSETAVKRMVDYFLLLLLPGAGDELQGIKRGIMEMADAVAINKADGENEKKANVAKADINRALHLYPKDSRDWTVPVVPCSALDGMNIDTIWQDAERFERHMKAKGLFDQNRQDQAVWWLKETISESLMNDFYASPRVKTRLPELINDLKANQISPFSAARALVALFLRN